MSTAEKWNLAVNVVMAAATVAAVVIALFQDTWKAMKNRVTLTSEPDSQNPSQMPAPPGLKMTGQPWLFLKLRLKNAGPGAANRVRATLSCANFPNPIPLRWSGTPEAEQAEAHIPKGGERCLDLIRIIRTTQTAPTEWRHVAIATQDRVKEENGGDDPFLLPMGGSEPGPIPTEYFTVEVFNDQEILHVSKWVLDRFNGTKAPELRKA